MGGTLWACGPDYTRETHEEQAIDSVYYRYSGFIDVKAILVRAGIDFLTTLSAKQISNALLVEAGICTAESIEGMEHGVVIANYRARIDAAIPILRSWVRTPFLFSFFLKKKT
jgi:hypothetical protein